MSAVRLVQLALSAPDLMLHMAGPRRTSGLTTTVIAIALLPSTSFCWKLVIASFLVTYYYYLYFIAGTFKLPRGVHVASSRAMRFAAQKALQITILAVFSVWCLSMTPVHLPTFISAFTPYTIHEPLHKTDVVYDAGENAAVDIFAIHGLGSKPDNSWIYNPNATRIRWLSLLPQIEGLRDIRVVEANHRARWDLNTVQMNFQDYASDLLQLIESRHKAHPDRPILFVAYSFSGLLLKKALLLAKSQSTDVAVMTRAIIFIGVPHRGTHDTFIASCLSCMSFFRGSSSNMLEAMSFDNPALIDLESEFYDKYVLQHHRYEKQPYICDVLESQPNSGIPRHGRVVTLDTDHRSLAKFQSDSDPNFQVLMNIIRQAIDYAVPSATITRRGTPGPSDILDYVSYGLPWAARSWKAAALLGGLEELTASWMAGDPSRYSSYFTARCLKMVFYRGVATASTSQGLGWVLRKVFEGHISNTARLLQILLSNTIVVPLQIVADLLVVALIAGAKTSGQFRATIRAGFRIYARLYCWMAPVTVLVAYGFLPQETWPWFFGLTSFLFYVWGNTKVKKKRLAALRKKRSRSNGVVRKITEIGERGAAEGDLPLIVEMQGEINEGVVHVDKETLENSLVLISGRAGEAEITVAE